MKSALLGAERCRADGLIRHDLQALRDLLCDDLFYVHATGIRHNKSEFLHFLENGPRFLAVDAVDVDAFLFGDAGVVTGRLHMSLLRRGETVPVQVSSWMSQTWIRAADSACGWRLRVFQSTRLVLDGA